MGVYLRRHNGTVTQQPLDVADINALLAVRDIAVLELLFATGVRVSELCALPCEDVRLDEGEVTADIARANVVGLAYRCLLYSMGTSYNCIFFCPNAERL
mgnify:CR=1 FL=1